MQDRQIKCGFYDYNTKAWNQYELDLDLNIYPCCFFHMDKIGIDASNDNTLDHIDISLKTNKLENVLKEFNSVLNEEIWNSDKCPKTCMRNCNES